MSTESLKLDLAVADLVSRGLNPEDYEIVVGSEGINLTAKPSREQRQITKEETKPIADDVSSNTDYLLEVDFRLLMIEMGLL